MTAAARIPVPDQGATLADLLVDAGEGTIAAVLMYGSHLNAARPGRGSAYDFVVIVDAYRPFHRALKGHGEIHRPLVLFDAVSSILPPHVIGFTPESGVDGMAKCLVVRRDHFERALGPRPRDHFLVGRMIQKVALTWSADEETAAWVQACLDRGRMGIPAWMAPFVEGEFDADEFGRRTLAVCYTAEIRPEAGDRSDVIFDAQREHFRRILPPVFEAQARAGRLVEGSAPGRWRYAEEVRLGESLYWRWHFLRSKLRSTARWFKHVLTFDNWLPYIARKVERRTGQTVELTPLERRLPLIFLWPRVFRVLANRPDRE